MLITRVISIFLALFQVAIPFVSNFVFDVEGFYDKWSPNDEYRLEDTVTIEKEPGKDFVVLNLTDTQLTNSDAFDDAGKLLKNTVRELVERVKPDLITLTGDNAWGYLAYIQLINLLDSFGIPWAPVMGNHDNSDEDTAWVSYRFCKSKNCVFSFGPEGMGYGNYIVNVTENGKVVESLIFMDTHDNADFTLADGTVVNGYDNVWSNQIEWYRWAVKGVQKYGSGSTVKSVVFLHIPIYEYKLAYAEAWNTSTSTWRDGYEAFGENNEGIWGSPVNNGFFAVMKELGSTTDCICGHDHANNFSVLYQGIRLTFALKTGSGCYWHEGFNGGTRIDIDSSGNTVITHQYVEPCYDSNIWEPVLWAY